MIKYYKYSEIDFEKYDNCISNAINNRVYAYSWYLNSVADNWDVLVLNDYEAVMPLPWRSKYFIKYVYLPIWTQQLGLFSCSAVSEELIQKFRRAIPKKFKKLTIQFNSNNKFNSKNSSEKINYILPLNKSYVEILAGFNSNRKRALKKAKNDKVIVDEHLSVIDFLNFYSEYSKFPPSDHKTIKLKKLLELKQSRLIGIRYKGKLESILLYFISNDRIIYLLPVSSEKGKLNGLPTLVITHLIEQNQNTNLIFDFEGSMVDGVAKFYKSFGSLKETYPLFTSNFLYFF
ncbi:hypothetical protein SAMN05444411_103105 [Lutibacter oricola]|uniref:Acetyltransferase (GNAT) domain-containing protein n=1 Tax=Lutibacter oricola TaxID=762486 RepID=A0A1H2YZR7_9FLAO|nr:hypothetical protein [Lutibacter oricola]SDX10581.1 hypothetical protein SAMN05444411_103105 [Lutibacter oricola]